MVKTLKAVDPKERKAWRQSILDLEHKARSKDAKTRGVNPKTAIIYLKPMSKNIFFFLQSSGVVDLRKVKKAL